MKREEIDNLNERESAEKLAEDCKNTKNAAMIRIHNDAVKHLEEMRQEYIKKYNISRIDQIIINNLFAFLKERA